MLVLDTHTLVWWMTDDRRIGRRTASALESASPGQIGVSVVTWCEMGSLHGRQRAQIRDRIHDFRRDLLRNGVVEIALTADMALDAAGLRTAGDPMDRLIVATARELRATLVTGDTAILSWRGDLQRMDATE